MYAPTWTALPAVVATHTVLIHALSRQSCHPLHPAWRQAAPGGVVVSVSRHYRSPHWISTPSTCDKMASNKTLACLLSTLGILHSDGHRWLETILPSSSSAEQLQPCQRLFRATAGGAWILSSWCRLIIPDNTCPFQQAYSCVSLWLLRTWRQGMWLIQSRPRLLTILF